MVSHRRRRLLGGFCVVTVFTIAYLSVLHGSTAASSAFATTSAFAANATPALRLDDTITVRNCSGNLSTLTWQTLTPGQLNLATCRTPHRRRLHEGEGQCNIATCRLAARGLKWQTFASSVLNERAWTRLLTTESGGYLPPIHPREAQALGVFFDALRSVLATPLHPNPGIVAHGVAMSASFLKEHDDGVASASPFESWLKPHVGLFYIDNWPPTTEGIMVTAAADMEKAIGDVRARGPSANLNRYVSKLGILHLTGAAGFADFVDTTDRSDLEAVHVDVCSSYVATGATGTGHNAPSEDACSESTPTLYTVFDDHGLRVGYVSSSMARTVGMRTPPLCHSCHAL